MSRAFERGCFAVLVIGLLLTHMLSVEQGQRPLILGWMPADLVYRIVWIAVAAAAVFWMTGRLWPNHE